MSACAPGAENSLCGILRNGKLTAVELIHSGTDGTYGCDTAPAFVQEAVALLEAAGIPKPKSIFGEFGLVEGTFDAAKATSTRRIAGPTWTADIEVWQDHDSIPLSCTLRVTQTLPRP